ncbi:MAG: inverse autotransporter beta domain-containing protein, partial [Gammaproteobacteria bacterium]|nr:inverse autotransporter beta domain-containing protein [Gammaproteobacteria bacterium]
MNDLPIKILMRDVFTPNKLKFIFSVLVLSACATKNDAYIEPNVNQEQVPASTKPVKNEANPILSSDAFAAVRASVDGAQVNQLGDRVSTALEQTVINKTENLINQTANEMANSVGQGKTEISFSQLETKNPNFSVKTIQPLSELTDKSTQLTFVQAQVGSGENHGERRATINLGIGQRYLLEEGQSIAGINLFGDYETESEHSRASIGLEYQRASFSANINQYYPLSDKVVIGDYTEEPLAGHDIKLAGQVPYLPWAKIKGTQYYWDAKAGDDIKGTRLGFEVDLNASTTLEIGTENSNTAGRSGYASLSVQLPYKANAPTYFAIADKAFEDSSTLSLTNLDYVERSNKIRIEKVLNDRGTRRVVLGEYNA